MRKRISCLILIFSMLLVASCGAPRDKNSNGGDALSSLLNGIFDDGKDDGKSGAVAPAISISQSSTDSTGSDADNQDEVSDTTNTVKGYSVVNVNSLESKNTSIAPLFKNVSSVENAYFENYSGNISRDNQEDVYTFTAPYDGWYRVDISELMSDTVVTLHAYDASGDVVSYDSYCTNGEGITLKDLSAGQVYTVKVKQDKKYSAYSLSIGFQKKTVNISGITEFTDSIEFEDQRNIYKFTPAKTGRYRFDLSEIHSGTSFEVYVYNPLGETVVYDSYCTNGEGVTAKELKAGEEYTVRVSQNEDYSPYKMNIGYQKETMDISQYSSVSDSIEFTDQKNVYTFTVPVDGRYRFEMSEMLNGTSVELYMYNSLGETVGYDSYCKSGEGITVKDLKAGEVYEIQVRQNEKFSSYVLSIGKQKESVAVTQNTVVNDSIEYTDQRNVYILTVTKAGSVTFTFSEMHSKMITEVYAFNYLGETVASDSGLKNGESITIDNCSIGDVFEIQVRQDSDFGTYIMTID